MKIQVVNQCTSGINSWRLTRTLTAEHLKKSVFFRGCRIALDGIAHDVRISKKRKNLIVGNSNAQRAKEDCCAHTTLTVNGDYQMPALVDFKLKPCTTCGNELGMVYQYAIIHFCREVHARRANKLRNHNALGTVDYKRTALGHERKVTHIDELFLFLARLLVQESDIHHKRSLIGHILGSALGNRADGVTKLVVTKDNFHRAVIALDR